MALFTITPARWLACLYTLNSTGIKDARNHAPSCYYLTVQINIHIPKTKKIIKKLFQIVTIGLVFSWAKHECNYFIWRKAIFLSDPSKVQTIFTVLEKPLILSNLFTHNLLVQVLYSSLLFISYLLNFFKKNCTYA